MDLHEENEYELELEKAKKEYLIAADFLKGTQILILFQSFIHQFHSISMRF